MMASRTSPPSGPGHVDPLAQEWAFSIDRDDCNPPGARRRAGQGSVRGSPGFFSSDPDHDRRKLLHRPEIVERIYHTIEVKGHVFVDDHVPKSGKAFESAGELGREPVVPGKVATGGSIVLEAVATPGRQCSGDFDDELADGEQGE